MRWVIDIKQLQYLIALDKTQHFGQAAEICHVTQPTLSMRLRNLERELDVILIKRSSRFEGFTEEGEKILKWAKTMQAAYDGLQAEAANFRQQLFGLLRIGIVPLNNIQPISMLQYLSNLLPEVRFHISSSGSEKIIDEINNNSLDIGICYLDNANKQQHEIYPLQKTKLGLLYNKQQFTPKGKSVSWETVSNLPLALLTQANHFRQSVDLTFQRYNLKPSIIIESESTLHLIQAVNLAYCASIIPLTKGIEKMNKNIDIIPIDDATVNGSLGLLIRREEPRSALIETCFQHMCEYLKKQQPE
ncbi:LysR family transcriptional regulator [Providencia sneebia]|uniref:LysR family transcriptional regulator n=1 Tax=Providencia sneebia DSM 19967 TaxID=1141660 RepID=K8WLZ6_9GAMM|nr:LysR family transcriptional regulator [Providencia sneebia]EKT58492.1 LysR family transcriptional regulator [Providencia sneebia DSM 19967]